jgi:hypothetical protein
MTDKYLGSNRQGDLPTEGHDAAVVVWQTMESAPEDEDVLLCLPRYGVTVNPFPEMAVGRLLGDGCWYSDCEAKDEYQLHTPTHWMPLPAAPDTASAAEPAGTKRRSEPKQSGNPMTTMLEKMARAQFDTYVRLSGTRAADVEEAWQEGRDGFIEAARAALQAIREVDERSSVFYDGLSAMGGYNDSGPVEPWQAMIDAILDEKPE